MKTILRPALVLLIAGMACTALAGVNFSNVVISGSLAGGASYTTGASDIDFLFPNALVGDPVDPLRWGDLIITYEAQGDLGIDQDAILLSVLGALSGSGTIFFNEVVEDVINPGIIATHNVVLDENSDLPHVATLDFDRPSRHVKVKKTVLLTAEDTLEFDLSSVALIEQRFHEVPEPGVAGLLGMGGLVLLRRRGRA